MSRQITCVQISDLHLGHIDPSPLAQQYSSVAPPWGAVYRQFQGLVGHHYRALQQLSAFYQGLADEKPRLVVSGDLTSCGHPDQFNTARDYLGGTLYLPKGRDGLHVHDWAQLTISGNHDQWPGDNRVLGAASAALARHVPQCPSVEPIRLPNGRSLCFIRVDTDCEVGSLSRARFLAQGKFRMSLNAAANQIGKADPSQIRVLLLHHSRLFGRPGPFQKLVMTANSRRALDTFLVEHNVRVMLCGHTHVARIKRHFARHDNGQRSTVLECCCGTTTQRDTIPWTWTNLVGRIPQSDLHPNTLMVHRIMDEPGGLVWRVELHVRKNGGFEPKKTINFPL